MELLRRRMRAHWLADRPGRTVESVVAHAVGIPAQDTAAARLAVRARSRGTTADEVRRAARERSVVRTWLMRGTLHLVTAEDVRWLLALFGARNAASGAGRRRQLGLDDDTCTRALAALPGILAGGTVLSRADLVDRLATDGVRIDPTGQAPAHLLGYAAARGVICRGPDLEGDEPGYVLLNDWVPLGPVPADEDALAELARRYVNAYGPAGPEDLAAWSGLPLGRARRGFALAAVPDVPDVPEAPATVQPAVRLRLLGAFDPYLLGYRTREPALDPSDAARVQAGGGIIHPVMIVDGRVVGTWRLRRATLSVEPFERLDPMPALGPEAVDIGRFLGLDVEVVPAVDPRAPRPNPGGLNSG